MTRYTKSPSPTRRIPSLMVDFLLFAGILPLIAGVPVASAQGTLEVGEGKQYATIQAAIDDASSGDTILVYPGTYREIVLIDKSITLLGVDRDTTIITDEDAGYSGKTDYATIGVGVDNVKISGLTVKATGNAGRTIHVSGWFNNKYPGQGFSAIPSNIEVSNNNIFYPSTGKKAGIIMWNTENVTIVGNAVVGEGSGANKGIGIYIQFVNPADWVNPNRDIEYGSGYTIENNVISGGSIGMSLGCIANFNISGNEVSGISCDITKPGKSADTDHGAIEVWYSYNGTIERNTVTNNEKGIAVWRDPGGDENVEVHYNNIVGNPAGLIAGSNVSKPVDAILNWWGTKVESEIDVMVQGDLIFDPWLDAPYPEGVAMSGGDGGEDGNLVYSPPFFIYLIPVFYVLGLFLIPIYWINKKGVNTKSIIAIVTCLIIGLAMLPVIISLIGG